MEVDLLGRNMLFDGLLSEDLSPLKEITSEVSIKRKEIIFHEGEKAGQVYGVIDGHVDLTILFREKFISRDIIYEESIVTREMQTKKNLIIDSVGPGEVLGWSGLVEPFIWTSSAIASEPTRLFAVPRDKFKLWMDTNPIVGYRIAMNLNRVISARLANRTRSLIETWTEYYDENLVFQIE